MTANDRQSDASHTTTAADVFPQEAYAHLAELEEGHFWFRSRNELIVWALRRYFPDAHRLLEVGCGTGIVLAALHEAFPALQLVGADISSEAIRVARQRVAADFVEIDALR